MPADVPIKRFNNQIPCVISLSIHHSPALSPPELCGLYTTSATDLGRKLTTPYTSFFSSNSPTFKHACFGTYTVLRAQDNPLPVDQVGNLDA